MLSWFKKTYHDLPDFWLAYDAKFESKITPPHRYVVLDTETTGFDTKNDRILSIGAVTVFNQTINVDNTLEIFLQQDVFNPKTVAIHGILKDDDELDTISELEALKLFLVYIGNAILVAHHAHFDITMINNALNRHGLPKLKNKVLDTGYLFKKSRIRSNLINQQENYSLDAVADALSVTIQDRHTAIGDAYITALVFLKLKASLAKLKKIKEEDLIKIAAIL
ncbi:MAG: 3'-5' exonuclease [Flavobacteriaceae bacterium]|nr:3'-5' exonuclease [Mangrovimonas sp.]